MGKKHSIKHRKALRNHVKDCPNCFRMPTDSYPFFCQTNEYQVGQRLCEEHAQHRLASRAFEDEANMTRDRRKRYNLKKRKMGRGVATLRFMQSTRDDGVSKPLSDLTCQIQGKSTSQVRRNATAWAKQELDRLADEGYCFDSDGECSPWFGPAHHSERDMSDRGVILILR